MGDILGTKTQTSTDTYTTILKLGEISANIHTITFSLKEQNVNAVKYKILGSNDDSTYETLQAETVIAKNGSDWQTISEPWRYIDVKIQTSVSPNPGSVKIVAAGN